MTGATDPGVATPAAPSWRLPESRMPTTPWILYALAAALAATSTAAQDRPKRALRHDAAAYVPTDEGTAWNYLRTTTRRELPGSSGAALVNKGLFGTYRRPDGSRWQLVGVDAGDKKNTFEHWHTEGPGLLVQATKTAVPAEQDRTACHLAAPVGAVNRWSWSEGTDAAPDERRATVVAAEEVVRVPAGTWKAVRIRVEAFEGGTDVATTTERWFVRDVGMVLEERTTPDVIERLELRSFTRGRDQSAERQTTLQMLAPPNWLWSARGAAKVVWLDRGPGSVAFGGRFAVVGDGPVRHCAFVRIGTMVELPTYGEWRAVLGTDRTWTNSLLAQTAAQVHAARLGLWDTRIEADSTSASARLRGIDATGARSFDFEAGGRQTPFVHVQETTQAAPASK